MQKIIRFLKHDIWKIRMADEPLGRRIWLRPLRLSLMTIRQFGRDQCALQASALTFYTLLSIVPVLALAFGVAKGFGLHETLEMKLRTMARGEGIVQVDSASRVDAANTEESQGGDVTNLTESQAKVVEQAITFASKMLDNAKGGIVAGLGVIILLWTVIKLLTNVEASFNVIWHVHAGRSWARRFSDYLSVMLVSPVLFLVSTSVAALLAGQFISTVESSESLAIIRGPMRVLLMAVPPLLFGLLFAFVYLFMPNTRVRPLSALYGGFFAGILYQIVQMAFVRFQIGISSANAIYGTFAALPLFLTWLQLSWMIVLLGAEFAYSHQFSDVTEFEEDQRELSPRFKRLVALYLMRECVADFAASKPAPTAEDLSRRIGAPMGIASDVVAELAESGILSQVIKRGNAVGYQPAADIANLRLADIVLRLDEYGREDVELAETEERRMLEEALTSFRDQLDQSALNAVIRQT